MAALMVCLFNIVFYSTIIKQWAGDYDKDVIDKDVSSSLPRAFEDERDASEQDNDNNNSSSLLHFRKWPLSRMDKVRQDPYMVAPIPSSPSDINDVDCPQCASILAGSVLHKRFLLLGHELLFAGAEVWLRDLGEMLKAQVPLCAFYSYVKKGTC